MKKWIYIQFPSSELISKTFDEPKKIFKAVKQWPLVRVIRTQENNRQVIFTIYQ